MEPTRQECWRVFPTMAPIQTLRIFITRPIARGLATGWIGTMTAFQNHGSVIILTA